MKIHHQYIKTPSHEHKTTSDETIRPSWEREGTYIFSNFLKESLSPREKSIVKELIIKGIPDKLRGKVWMLTSGARRALNENVNYYSHLCELSRTVPSWYEKQIDVDIERTETTHYNLEHSKHLRQILICYSIRNSTIGYCQGFNYIVSKLYRILNDEEETFWCFTQIIEEILPINFYSEWVGLITYAKIISSLIKDWFPDWKEVFKKGNYEINVWNFLHKWLIGLFTQNWNENVCNYIWDLFLLQGSSVLIQVSWTMFHWLEDQWRENKNGLNGIYKIWNDQTNTWGSRKLFYSYFKNNSFKYTNEQWMEIWVDWKQYLYKDRRESPKRINSNKSNELDMTVVSININHRNNKCNINYPYCFQRCNMKVKKSGIESLVYSAGNNSEIINEYFSGDRPGWWRKEKQEIKDIFDIFHTNLVLERSKHCCSLRDDSESKLLHIKRFVFNIARYSSVGFKEENVKECNLNLGSTGQNIPGMTETSGDYIITHTSMGFYRGNSNGDNNENALE